MTMPKYVALALLLFLPLVAVGSEPEIRMKQGHGDRTVFEVAGLEPSELESLAKLKADSPSWSEVLSVRVRSTEPIPPMLGKHRLDGKTLVFEPRFPLAPGVTYHVVLKRSAIPGHSGDKKPIEATFRVPNKAEKAPAVVEKVYPTSSKLPENQLKFYLHFSAPMSRGEAYRHVHLLDKSGKEVESPFLELGEELWDPAGKRFTLFFDPGRIKRGLKPREELGPCLIAGKDYTLRIDRTWADADGKPLKENFEKKFHVAAPIEEKVEVKAWKLETPQGGTTQPLTVRFQRPLDHALVFRMIHVTGDKGDRIDGTIEVSDAETVWRFRPAKEWNKGVHHLVIDNPLEDLAGNSVAAPFEVDVFKPIQRESKSGTTSRTFEVK